RGLLETPRGSPARRRAPVRAQADRGEHRADDEALVRAKLVCEPARQDVRNRRCTHLRRLLQLRSALGAPEHRDGPRHRQPHARATVVAAVRSRRSARCIRGALDRRRPPRMDRPHERRRVAACRGTRGDRRQPGADRAHDAASHRRATVTHARATRRDWLGLAVIALPCVVYAMDLTVLNLAIPSISRDLKPSAAQLLWIIDIYGFMVAGMLITMGTLGDRIGRRRLLMI